MVTRIKVFNFVLCFVVSIAAGSAVAASESLTDLKLTILDVSRSGSLTVSISNSSRQKSLKVWTESNSWGAYRWRVVLIRKGQVRALFEDADEVLFTRNQPRFDEIAIESHIDRQLDLNDGKWSGTASNKVHFEPDDQVIVIYDVPPEVEAQKMHVWYGVVAASATVK